MTQQQEQQIDIRFSPASLQYVLGVLQDRPHREVAGLLADLIAQVQAQAMQPQPPAGAAAPAALNGHAPAG